MISNDKEVGPSSSTATDTRRELVDRVVVSSTFAKCGRLSSLLTYVCDLTLKGRAKEINEQRIGESVFGRSRDYDSSIDGIVRTQASRLRQRLDLYFSEEGADEPIRIVIPRGGYVPFFEPRPPTHIAPLSPTPAPIAPPVLSHGEQTKVEVPYSKSAALAWGVVAILAIAILTMLLSNRGAFTKTQATPAAVHPFWSQMFVAEQPILIVPGDSGLVMWQGLMNRNMGLAEYLGGDYRTKIPATATSFQKGTIDLGSRRYTSIVDLEVVHFLSQISQKSKLEVRYARDVRPNDLKQGNVILIGAAEANPWVELFEHNMNFVFFNDRVHQTYSVLNRTPTGDEARQWDSEYRQWDSEYTDKQHRVYGVVAYVPNLSGNGNVLILEGTSMAGTECAWDFVSDDSQLLPFLRNIRRADGTLPHFEVVLGTNNVSGSAVKSSILAWRTTN
jgi:hypothetical protein